MDFLLSQCLIAQLLPQLKGKKTQRRIFHSTFWFKGTFTLFIRFGVYNVLIIIDNVYLEFFSFVCKSTMNWTKSNVNRLKSLFSLLYHSFPSIPCLRRYYAKPISSTLTISGRWGYAGRLPKLSSVVQCVNCITQSIGNRITFQLKLNFMQNKKIQPLLCGHLY